MDSLKPHQKRLIEFDPKPIYDRIKVDRYKRIQSIPIGKMFPKNGELCGCGCGQKLTGRRTRWASDDCSRFAMAVYGIINGRSEITSFYLRLLNKHWACCKCGQMDKYKEYKNGLQVNAIHKDHIIAVKNGGGGCWLDNYQLLCDECHKEKTKSE